jgi:hypothetical protein
MVFSPELVALGKYLAGEFENKQQALAEPAWYVNLRLWQRPIPLFREDSITLFAEQASVIDLDCPYRPRILRLKPVQTNPQQLQVEYYMFKDITAIAGASRHPELLKQIKPEQIEFLPNCTLNIQIETLSSNNYRFQAFPASDTPCSFIYQGNTYQVALGFAVTWEQLETYDKGIDPKTGKAIWGALLGPYRFTKCQDFSSELFIVE